MVIKQKLDDQPIVRWRESVLGKRRVYQRNPSIPLVVGSAFASQVLCFELCGVICLWELTVHEEESRGNKAI